MRIKSRGHTSHLSYCTNIHAAEHWEDVYAGLQIHVPTIRSALNSVSPEPFGLGLRVAASAATALKAPNARNQLLDLLDRLDCYVFTINGFPYGNFHGNPVKEDAYRPDWSEDQRLQYTNSLAQLLADIIPDDITGSVSTVPGSFKPWVLGNSDLIEKIVDNLIQHVAHLMVIKRTTGKTIALSLEPEPCCMLETIDETIDFFKQNLFCKRAVNRLTQLTGMSFAECETAIHNHIGVCYDVCHAAVEFENAKDSIAALKAEQIEISKVQLSSALRVQSITEELLELLKPFAEPIYFHQVVQRSISGELIRFTDLGDALNTGKAALGTEWRIHYHVPIFLNELEHFETTQNFLKDVIAIHNNEPITEHFEVETYTWDVLPDEYRNVDVGQAIAREISWVKDQLR